MCHRTITKPYTTLIRLKHVKRNPKHPWVPPVRHLLLLLSERGALPRRLMLLHRLVHPPSRAHGPPDDTVEATARDGHQARPGLSVEIEWRIVHFGSYVVASWGVHALPGMLETC